MECPRCRLLNTPGAQRCDCSYDFASGQHWQQQRLASLGARLLGQLLDSLVFFLIFFVPVLLLRTFADQSGALRWVTVIALLLAALYLMFSDGFTNGQSWGKIVVKTAVVDARSGVPCSFGQSFLRNLVLGMLGPIDWVFIFGEKRQRLGDQIAHTIVISIH